MLFPKELWAPIAAGRVTVAFRRWRRPTVRADGTLRSPAGRLAITAVDIIDPALISDEDAVRAGADDRAQVLEALAARGEGQFYRIEFHVLDGPDPRAQLADDDDLDAAAIADLRQRLDRKDVASSWGSWTRPVLRLIAARPEVAARELAAQLGMDRDDFKRNVRKLKALGLTSSHRIGYRVTPRGRAFLAADGADATEAGDGVDRAGRGEELP